MSQSSGARSWSSAPFGANELLARARVALKVLTDHMVMDSLLTEPGVGYRFVTET